MTQNGHICKNVLTGFISRILIKKAKMKINPLCLGAPIPSDHLVHVKYLAHLSSFDEVNGGGT
jgi:hypothetical protein